MTNLAILIRKQIKIINKEIIKIDNDFIIVSVVVSSCCEELKLYWKYYSPYIPFRKYLNFVLQEKILTKFKLQIN